MSFDTRGLDPADGYPYTPPTIAMAAGDERQQAHQFAVNIDIAMRQHYASNLKALSKTLYPVLYTEATFSGGRYTFAVDEHTSYVCQESSPVYTQLKAIAHIPLGVYSIIFPYAKHSTNGQWLEPLRVFSGQITSVLERLEHLDIPEAIRNASERILSESIAFMARLLEEQKFTIEQYETFCHSIGDAILTNQTSAAKDQVEVMRGYLLNWKDLVGEKTWDKMYVVCQCLWTVSQESAHEQIIKSTMKPEYHDTHMIVSEAVPTLDAAKLLLARIIADRVLAASVFNKLAHPEFPQNIYSLSTERDLLARSVGAELIQSLSRCPHGHS